jgi:uncharacterized protein YbjT (DUF2867 family)
MSDDERPVLVIGATGFLGGRVVAALLANACRVRCLARSPERAAGLAGEGVEVRKGDMLEAGDVSSAVAGASAVIVCVHTLSPQGAAAAGQQFMDVEATGLQHVVTACQEHGVRRVLYVTSIGVAADATSSWLRGRWLTEQTLLTSGLDVTVVRPGMIVGRGGDGFGIVARGATRRVAVAFGSPSLRFRTIAVDDCARDIVDLLDRPEAVGQAFEVGSDDVLTMRQMMAVAAASLGRRPALAVFLPAGLVRLLAPLIERVARLPRGAIGGLVGDGPQADMVGDPSAVRALLNRVDRPFHEAVEGQLG